MASKALAQKRVNFLHTCIQDLTLKKVEDSGERSFAFKEDGKQVREALDICTTTGESYEGAFF